MSLNHSTNFKMYIFLLIFHSEILLLQVLSQQGPITKPPSYFKRSAGCLSTSISDASFSGWSCTRRRRPAGSPSSSRCAAVQITGPTCRCSFQTVCTSDSCKEKQQEELKGMKMEYLEGKMLLWEHTWYWNLDLIFKTTSFNEENKQISLLISWLIRL